jgi:hypothetical protein
VAEHGVLQYNLGENVLGTSAPGYALLLGFLTWVSGGKLGPPQWGTLLSLGSLCVATYSLRAFMAHESRWIRFSVPALFAMLAFTSRWNLEIFGGEALPVLALAIAGIAAGWKGADTRSGLLLAAGASLRLDAAIAGAVLITVLTVKNRRIPWRLATIWGAPVTAFASWLVFQFGAVVPQTFVVKRWRGPRDSWSYSLEEWRWLRRCMPQPSATVVLILAVGAAIALVVSLAAGRRPKGAGVAGRLIREQTILRLGRLGAAALTAPGTFILWIAVHEALYRGLGVSFAPWYGVPLLNAALAFAALGIVTSSTFLAR